MKTLKPFDGITSEEMRMLVVLGAGAFLLSGSLYGINVALPEIQKEFHVGLTTLKWASIIGSIMMASLSLCFGRVGDLLGRRRIYRLGIVIYAVGSGFAALATSFKILMVFRVLMALGLPMAYPLAAAIMAATVAPQRRGQVMGLYATFTAAGALTGPTIAGFLVDTWGWRAVFLGNMTGGVILVIVQQFMLKGHDERRRESFDYLGAVLLLIGFPSFLLGLSSGTQAGWSAPITFAWFGLSALGLSAFLFQESRSRVPLFRLEFFRSLPFCVAMFTLAVGSFIQSPVTLFTPLYLSKVLDLRPLDVGLIMIALPLSTIFMEPLGGSLADRKEPRVVASAGIFFSLIAVIIYSRLGVGSPVLLVIVPLALIGLGGAFLRPANQVAVYATVDREQYGALSAILTALGALASALGATVTVALHESRGLDTGAAAFARGQQFTFAMLIPVMALSILVSLLGRPKKMAPETPVAEAVTRPTI
jgi:EmrB/QacA subfamily drug resistance transporter